MSNINRYPLCWPDGYPRTENPQKSRFRSTSFETIKNNVFYQVFRLGGENVILSTNIPLRNDGTPYAEYGSVGDNGVAIYFDLKGKPTCIACDAWSIVMDNMNAVALTLEAMRGIDRWGCTQMLDRMFTGFQGLPAAGETFNADFLRECFGVRSFEELDREWSDERLKVRHRELCKMFHPDGPGFKNSGDEFIRLSELWEEIKKRRGIK